MIWRSSLAVLTIGVSGLVAFACSSNGDLGERGSSSGAGGDNSFSTGAGEGQACTLGQTQACYEGAPGTQNVGACKDGVRVCASATSVEVGKGTWGECAGQVLPTTEACNQLDDNCDGTVDEGCPCADGDSGSCSPVTEICGNGVDDNLDGRIDETCTDACGCTAAQLTWDRQIATDGVLLGGWANSIGVWTGKEHLFVLRGSTTPGADSTSSIFLARYANDGTYISTTLLVSANGTQATPKEVQGAAWTGSELVVVFDYQKERRLQRFSLDGATIGAPTILKTMFLPRIAWSGYELAVVGTTGKEARFQRFGQDLTPLGPEVTLPSPAGGKYTGAHDLTWTGSTWLVTGFQEVAPDLTGRALLWVMNADTPSQIVLQDGLVINSDRVQVEFGNNEAVACWMSMFNGWHNPRCQAIDTSGGLVGSPFKLGPADGTNSANTFGLTYVGCRYLMITTSGTPDTSVVAGKYFDATNIYRFGADGTQEELPLPPEVTEIVGSPGMYGGAYFNSAQMELERSAVSFAMMGRNFAAGSSSTHACLMLTCTK